MTSYKKTTGRLHWLNRLLFHLVMKTAATIYKPLIILVFTYCSVLSIFDNKSRADHLKSIDSGATRIVNRHVAQVHSFSLPSIASIEKKHACLFVRECIDWKLCENFAKYFSLQSHEKRTRNNSSVWICHLLELNSRKDLFISQVLSSAMSYLYRFDN